MDGRCRNEVEQLHRFFQDWFLGAAANTDSGFERVASVLAADFQLISPRGQIHDRGEILALIRDAYGKREPGFRIWIEGFEARFTAGPLCIATYREWQQSEQERTCRMSTAVFREHAAAPNGVEWTHLHETWLPVGET